MTLLHSTTQTTRVCLEKGVVPARVSFSRFRGRSGVDEYHVTAEPTVDGSIEEQLDWVYSAYIDALDSLGIARGTTVFRRFFCSDIANQRPALQARAFSNPRRAAGCAVSWVGQPPMPPSKVALWAYHIHDPAGLQTAPAETSIMVRRGPLTHHWTPGITAPAAGNPHAQTQVIFEDYDGYLQAQGLTLSDHVVRTWLYVRDIDVNYQGMVAARKEHFARHGLTADTHFIASTGVQGGHYDPAALVTLDAYAIAGLQPGQLEFLAAPEHLSPTHVYGVTFERGVAVRYRDRKHVVISGTASIDREGKILHEGDVARQLNRTLENIQALLAKADANLEACCAFLVYVRDPADYALARQHMRDRVGDAPMVVLAAPVCRPGWLIEVEAMAIIPEDHPNLPLF